MASFAEAPAANLANGEKIFKTKCAQCHTSAKGEGHKQVRARRCSGRDVGAARTSHLVPRPGAAAAR
jgi:mono/diheme cytochrome c family protein